MENMKPDFDLHIQKSFSFTAFSKFKDSSLEFFSSDDDEELNDIKTHKNDDTATNNSYIEISLDHHHQNNPKNDNNNNNSHLRISFSSSFPSIPETRSPNPAGPEPPSLSPGLRSSSTGAFRASPELFQGSRRWDDGTGEIPAAFNPLVHTLLFSLETHPSPSMPENTGFHGGDGTDRPFQMAMVNADTNIHRKSPNITTTSTTGNRNGIMNKLLMIKFRATKVKKLISALFTKSRSQVNVCYSNKIQNDISHGKKRKKRQQNSKDHYYDRFSHANDNKNHSYDNYEPRTPEVKSGTARGVLEAVNGGDSATKNNNANNYNNNGRTNNRRKTSSCPNSIKSSPIHQGFGGAGCNINGTALGGENSIMAAIAHCKSSLGQSTDFRF